MNELNVQLELEGKLKGRFQLTRRKADTLDIVEQTPWFDNVILDQGLERFGAANSDIGLVCKVGTSSTTPATNQTALLGFVAATAAVQSTLSIAQAAPPYFGQVVRTFRFATGAAAGTLAEVGVGWAGGNAADTLWCRALILDILGAPTTITVLADEVLDVTYELRIYPDLIDKVFQTTIAGVVHDCILRPGEVTNNNRWADIGILNQGFATGTWPTAYSGALGGVTVAPSGGAALGNPNEPTRGAYVPGSRQMSLTSSWGLNDGNLVGGISAFMMPTTIGEYKMSFSPSIAKDNTKTLTLGMNFTWGRYP
jgi:hypothetical protein